MAEHLAMGSNTSGNEYANLFEGTAGATGSGSLISGTVLHVAGSGLNLTSALCVPIRVLLRPAFHRYKRVDAGITPIVRRAGVKSRRRERSGEKLQVGSLIGDILALERPSSRANIEIREKVRHLSPGKPGVRLLGPKGSGPSPSGKHYDVDLDVYQFD